MVSDDRGAGPSTLEAHVILVTGASGGLGRAVSKALAALGATVVLHGRDEARLVRLYDELVADGAPEPAAIPLDFSAATTRHFDALAADIATNLGRLDGIVHCARLTRRLMQVDAVSAEDWSEVLRVNLVAPLGITRSCIPLLREAEDACVIYTLESHRAAASPYWAGSSAPDAALEVAMKCQAKEWDGVPGMRFNAVVPGPIATPSRRITHPGELEDERPAPESVVHCYARLLLEGASGVSGEVIDAQS